VLTKTATLQKPKMALIVITQRTETESGAWFFHPGQ
jgi:hypothetical protein